jgi:hypothetical protein
MRNRYRSQALLLAAFAAGETLASGALPQIEGDLSLALMVGVAREERSSDTGEWPAFFGLTGAVAVNEVLAVVASAHLITTDFPSMRLRLGPRLSLQLPSLRPYAATQAGPGWAALGGGGSPEFGVSQEVGVEVPMGRRVLAGGGYAVDVVFAPSVHVCQRAFIHLGWRW